MEIGRKKNQAATIYFPLITAGGTDFDATPLSFSAGDVKVSLDGAAFSNTTNLPAHVGGGIYSLALTAAELNADDIVVTLIDSATKAWEDQAVLIVTRGVYALNGFPLTGDGQSGTEFGV